MSKLEKDPQEICGEVDPEKNKPAKESVAATWILFSALLSAPVVKMCIYGVNNFWEFIFWILLEVLFFRVVIMFSW